MKRTFVIIAAAAFAFSCQNKHSGAFIVSGVIQHADGQKVVLQELPFGGENPVALDSAALKANGSFELRGIGREEGLYRIVIGNGPDVLLVNDNNDIRLNLDINDYRNYRVTNSPASESLHTLFEDYRKKDSALYQTFARIDTLQKQNATDSAVAIVRAARDAQIKEMNAAVTSFIRQSPSPAARYYALGMGSRTMNQAEVLALANESAEKFPEHTGLAKIKALLTIQKPEAPKYALLNQQAPEITLPDLDGKTFSLSSLKGKYVLVDFWASWCGPCRKENPNVVAAYAKYKDRNFAIVGVSLDSEKENWQQAVKDDHLNWIQVSDLKHWQSPMVGLYHFDGIPFNVLVDPQGKIIASELRGPELEKKLAEVLK